MEFNTERGRLQILHTQYLPTFLKESSEKKRQAVRGQPLVNKISLRMYDLNLREEFTTSATTANRVTGFRSRQFPAKILIYYTKSSAENRLKVNSLH